MAGALDGAVKLYKYRSLKRDLDFALDIILNQRLYCADYKCLNDPDLPALTGPGSELVYAASWIMGNSFPGTMISGAGSR